MRAVTLTQITTTGAKSPIKVEAENPSVYITANSGAFNVQPQVSHDGTTWFNIGSALTGVGVTVITGKIMYLRLNVASIGTSINAAYVF
jgi:hypothetical protein